MMTGTSLRLSACAKTFANGTRALEPLDLTIDAGETIVLLGPSGCGKTTLLRIIAGLEAPDTGGQVLFDDEDVTPQPIERRNVGMVFQSYALFPNMTVRQNIAYGLRVRRLPRAQRDERVAEMLAMMRIEELADRQVDQLSGGQRQRVALARAIAVRPRVLLLDEPLTALDALLRQRLRVEIDLLLRGLGITAVYVTHDQAEAMALGDRIVVMGHGRIEQIGSPRQIYTAPQSRFVAGFIGTVNRLQGTCIDGKFAVGETRIALPDTGRNFDEILFRPEAVEIVAPDSSDSEILVACVRAAFYMGDRTRLIVDHPHASELTIEGLWSANPAVGDRVAFRIRPSGIMTLPQQTEP